MSTKVTKICSDCLEHNYSMKFDHKLGIRLLGLCDVCLENDMCIYISTDVLDKRAVEIQSRFLVGAVTVCTFLFIFFVGMLIYIS